MPVIQPTGTASPRPLSASSSFSSIGTSGNYVPAALPSTLAPPPIMPGSALRLLNQGRAQGLFTPSTSILAPGRPSGFNSPGPYPSGAYAQSPFPQASQTPPPNVSLKRNRSEADVDALTAPLHGEIAFQPLAINKLIHRCRSYTTRQFTSAVNWSSTYWRRQPFADQASSNRTPSA